MSRRARRGARLVALIAVGRRVTLCVADGNGDDGRANGSRECLDRPAPGAPRTHRGGGRPRRAVRLRRRRLRARSGGTTAAVERYDIDRNRWRRVRSMPVGLNHPAAAAYRGDVYVLGGYTGRGDLRGEVSSLYRYDPERNRWSRLPNAPTKRAALAVGVIGGKLYAAGGANAADGALKTLEIYDFKRRRWSRGPDMAVAREHLAGAVAGGAFYVLAGRAAGQGNFKVAERYLPRAGALGAPARHAQAARRDRGGGRRPARGRVRRRGGGGHDRGGRDVRPGDPPLEPACRTCARRATASAACRRGPPGLRDRGRADARASTSRTRSRRSTSARADRRRPPGSGARAAARCRCRASSISARWPPMSVFACKQPRGHRRGRPSGRPSAPPRAAPSFTYQAVNLPSSGFPATRSRPSRSPGRRTPCSTSRRGRTRSRARRRTPACWPSMLSAAYLPWLKATSQCSIRRRRPCTTLSYSAMSPAAKMPGALVSRYRSVSTPLSVSIPACSARWMSG